MKKYKTEKIPDYPDWMPEGIVCKVWDSNRDFFAQDTIYRYIEDSKYKFVGVKGVWPHAEPILRGK